ncbi:hypothetical protein BFJ72_g15350 [Fusarium proliferatum]|uniref:Uncharacterized protein n=1 Tax=Gibberella intermedia TaxID=948311 RepID=A0A420REC2_GIBIN|nr:hypothetical protein BFJ72_g15350 [Fusarium proliferatum]
MATALTPVTDENLDQLHEDLQALKGTPGTSTGGGGGGYHERMEARVSALEEAVKNLPTKADMDGLRQATKADLEVLRLATKADLMEVKLGLKSDLLATENGIIKWMVMTAVGLGAAAITVMTFVLNNATPKAPTAISQPAASQQPIIINVPPASPAQAAPQQQPAP